jgi:hypothetical protein
MLERDALHHFDGLEQADDLEHAEDLDDAQDPVVAVVLDHASLLHARLPERFGMHYFILLSDYPPYS